MHPNVLYSQHTFRQVNILEVIVGTPRKSIFIGGHLASSIIILSVELAQMGIHSCQSTHHTCLGFEESRVITATWLFIQYIGTSCQGERE